MKNSNSCSCSVYEIVCLHDLGLQEKGGASKVQNPLNSCSRSKTVVRFDLDSGGENSPAWTGMKSLRLAQSSC